MSNPNPPSDKSGLAALFGTGLGLVVLLTFAIAGAAAGAMMMMR